MLYLFSDYTVWIGLVLMDLAVAVTFQCPTEQVDLMKQGVWSPGCAFFHVNGGGQNNLMSLSLFHPVQNEDIIPMFPCCED